MMSRFTNGCCFSRSIISYLAAGGQDFCSSFISYSVPTSTSTVIITPIADTASATATFNVTSTSPYTTTITAVEQWKHKRLADLETSFPYSSETLTPTLASGYTVTTRPVPETTSSYSTQSFTSYSAIANVPPNSAVVLGYNQLPTPAPNVTTTSPGGVFPTAMARRQAINGTIPTPTSIVGWPACLVSQACVQVATGVYTSMTTTTAPIPTVTETTTTTSTPILTTLVGTCTLPSEYPAYTSFTPIWGNWSGDTVQNNPQGASTGLLRTFNSHFQSVWAGYATAKLQSAQMGTSTTMMSAHKSKCMLLLSPARAAGCTCTDGPTACFTGSLAIPGHVSSPYPGTLEHITKVPKKTISAFCFGRAHRNCNSDITMLFRRMQRQRLTSHSVSYNSQVVQSVLGSEPLSNVCIDGVTAYVYPVGNFSTYDMQLTMFTESGSTAVLVGQSTHNRVDCCNRNGWHSCTEFQPAVA
jgi:hypothetical protein